MFSEYYFLYATLGVLLAAFVPGIIAARKERSFTKWFVYAVLLFPVAFIHSLVLKKPVHRINIFSHSKTDPTKRGRKSYLRAPKAKKKAGISPKHLCIVFITKLVFSAFAAFSVFALFRTIVPGTDTLKQACFIFAIVFAAMLSVVELLGLSKFPRIADEITKRALIIIAFSIVCSLPLYLLKTYVAEAIFPDKYADFVKFIFVLTSFGVFIALLLRRQRVYYSAFNHFPDYTLLSMCAYAMFAGVSLLWMSVSDIREFIYAVAMPTQVFNMDYLSDVKVIGNLSYIYSSVALHMLVEGIILASGLLCKGFKKKEMEFRVEYRSKAFRMSRKRILHSHNR